MAQTSSSLKDRYLCWEAIPAEPRQSMHGAYPKGSVRLYSEDGSEEFVSVPACVARSMMRLAKEQQALVPGMAQAGRYRREEILRLIDRTSTLAAKGRVIALLERRDYPSQELVERLECEGFSHTFASKVVGKACEAGYVNDERFAESFVRSKVASGWGLPRIERALAKKGIAPDALAGWPDDYLDPDDELDRALSVARRKQVREPNAFQKMVRFLMSRGFGYAVAKEAAERILADED